MTAREKMLDGIKVLRRHFQWDDFVYFAERVNALAILDALCEGENSEDALDLKTWVYCQVADYLQDLAEKYSDLKHAKL